MLARVIPEAATEGELGTARSEELRASEGDALALAAMTPRTRKASSLQGVSAAEGWAGRSDLSLRSASWWNSLGK